MPPTLAQIMIAPGLQAPPELPAPPMLEHYLLENPYPVMLALGLAAVILLTLARQRLPFRTVVIGAGLAVSLAIVLWLVAWRVVTPREQIIRRTQELVAAVAKAAPQSADPILSDGVTLYTALLPQNGVGKTDILHMIQTDMSGMYRLHEHRVRDVQVLLEGEKVARAHVLVMVDPEETRAPSWSWWRLDWVLEQDGWRVHAIEPLSIQGMDRPGRR